MDQLWENTSTSTATDEFQYAYDVLSNRTSMTNAVNSAFDESYSYDDLNQLTGFSRGSHTQDFNYDAVGNFDSVTTDGGTAQTRSANAQNEITSISGATTPTYDSNGNMTGDETGRQFVYDAWNRLVTVKNSGGTTLETFSYDGLNRRVTQTAGGTTTDLSYSKDWQTLTESVGGVTNTRYVWSPVYVDAMVLRDRDTNADGTLDERLWVQQDANWNVTALVNGSGSVVERYAYDPYGVRTVYDASYAVRSGGSSYDFQHGFQGMRFDSAAGLNEANRRWYSPTQQVWVTMDPTRYSAGDMDLYRFVGNNPVRMVDPLGLWGVGGQVTFAGDFGTVLFGAGGQATVGLGYFSGNPGAHLGGFFTYGAAAGWRGDMHIFPKPQDPNVAKKMKANAVIAGLSGGVTPALFFTNADNVSEIKDDFLSANVNFLVVSVNASWDPDPKSNTFVASIGAGPWSNGISASFYSTYTKVTKLFDF